MKNILLFSLVFLCIHSTAFSQSGYRFFIQAGVAQSHQTVADLPGDTNAYLPFRSLQFGGGLQQVFKERFYWQASVHHTTLGKRRIWADGLLWATDHDGMGGVTRPLDPTMPRRATNEQRIAYFSFQAGLGYYLLKGEKFRIGAMPFAAANFLWSSKDQQRLYLGNGKLHSADEATPGDPMRKVNVSTGLALSIEAKITGQFSLFLSPEATYYLLPVTPAGTHPVIEQRYFSYGLNIGAVYHL